MFASGKAASASAANYIEDVFSTYLYTGNGSTQTITNGIDLAGKGGLVWTKKRQDVSGSTDLNHILFDTVRVSGANDFWLSTNNTNAQLGGSNYINYNSNGFDWTFGGSSWNGNTDTFASWTFRKQPKFFDVVTYTGDGVDGRAISHSLGSVPGCILLKKTSAADDWYVYHRSGGNGTSNGLGVLNSTAAFDTGSNAFGGPGSVSVAPTSTTFTIRNSLNASGATYVAYLFAHNAGGFGMTGTDNVISCGSYTGNGSATGPVVTLGYEPQWLLVKSSSSTWNWIVVDNMRGFPSSTSGMKGLNPNNSNAEFTESAGAIQPTSTGFTVNSTYASYNESGGTYIYIAIRRGPMKVPTSGTSVFSPVAYTGNATDTTRSAGFPVDMLAILRRSNPFGDGDGNPRFMDRLRGGNSTSLISSSSSAEETSTNNTLYLDNSVGFKTTANNAGAPTGYYFNVSTNPYIAECFRRAPSFFDEVCYTGTGSARTINHNLGVAPELMIVKARVSAGGANRNWAVYASSLGAGTQAWLNTTDAAFASSTIWANTSPTASVFSVSTNVNTNYSGATYVTYLFATCTGVSKVGSYTGTGTTKQVDCGFTGGARFVLIKRTDSTGDWYVWDSARGIVAGNDPYLLLNSTAAEVTSTDYIDTYSAGFEISSTAPAAINASGGTYIYLAIA